MKASQEKYLESLDKKLAALDVQIKQRKAQQQKVNAIFIEHVKKELQMLEGEQANVKERNATFLNEVRHYLDSFNRFAPQVMEIDDKIIQSKERFLAEYIDHQGALSQYESEQKNRY